MRTLLLSSMEEHVLTIVFVWVSLILNSATIGIFIVFLFYLHGAATILKENHIIDMPPWFVLTLEIILTFLFLGVGGLVIPIYIWVKSRKLAEAVLAKPFDVKRSQEEEKARTKSSVIGALAIVSGIFIELWLLTVGLLSVLYAYALNKDSSIFVQYFIALAFGMAVVAGGIGTLRRRRWARTVFILLGSIVIMYIIFCFFKR